MVTRVFTPKHLTDLDVGRRPKLKSEEFFEVPPLVVEIWSEQKMAFFGNFFKFFLKNCDFLKKILTFQKNSEFEGLYL